MAEENSRVAKMYQYEYDAELAKKASYDDGVEREKIETVNRMMRAGMAINVIEVATDWTEEQILAVVERKPM